MNSDNSPESQFSIAVRSLFAMLRRTFSLRMDTDYKGTLQQVRQDVEYTSGNTWALAAAIVIASVGLNINSTAVIIGAMLISPLMGPIMGAGFGLATNDLFLLRRSARNLLLAVVVGIIASTLYFAISPLEGPQSELLARTRPTLYDVIIALFGGIAGFVAVSRKSGKGNVIPGVAIATALMPPLCTAGYGLATGQFWFFVGAFHLFLINVLFISLATMGIARVMRFRPVAALDRQQIARARIALAITMFVVVVPSIYTGWAVVHEARFQKAGRQFIADNLNFPDRALINTELKYSPSQSTISATLLGQPLAPDTTQLLEQRLVAYGLEGTKLVLLQPGGATSTEQLGQYVRQGILEDLYKRNEEALAARESRIRVLEDEVVKLRATEYPVGEVAKELATLFPHLKSLAVAKEVHVPEDAQASAPQTVVIAAWKRLPNAVEHKRVREFLALRLRVKAVRLVNVNA